jgi:hypothetical protein
MKITSFIVCDDIRNEAGNKISLMGIYNEKIIFVKSKSSTWPRVLRIGIFSEAKFIKEPTPSFFELEVIYDKKEISKARGDIVEIKSSNNKLVRIHFVIPAITFKNEGIMKFKISFFDKDKKLIKSISPDREISVEEQSIEDIRKKY